LCGGATFHPEFKIHRGAYGTRIRFKYFRSVQPSALICVAVPLYARTQEMHVDAPRCIFLSSIVIHFLGFRTLVRYLFVICDIAAMTAARFHIAQDDSLKKLVKVNV